MLLTVKENKISRQIHPSAIIDSTAQFGQNVSVGPYSIIENNVTIGDNTSIKNHVTIKSQTTIGKDCQIYQSAVIGEAPQDLKYSGEVTQTEIGNNTIIREFVTINKGTKAYGKTVVGNNVLCMAYVHIAHDCVVGDNVMFANLVTLGGHVRVEEWASLGGGVLVHQFSKIGAHAFVGGGYRIVQDIPPFILAAGEPMTYSGINRIGLKRRGFSQSERNAIKLAYRLVFRSQMSRSAALEKIKSDLSGDKNVDQIIDFITSSERGII